jgi:hypothetical protein
MDTSYVAVAVVTSRTEAELIAGLLRSNGLEAAVSADDAGGQGLGELRVTTEDWLCCLGVNAKARS